MKSHQESVEVEGVGGWEVEVVLRGIRGPAEPAGLCGMRLAKHHRAFSQGRWNPGRGPEAVEGKTGNVAPWEISGHQQRRRY